MILDLRICRNRNSDRVMQALRIVVASVVEVVGWGPQNCVRMCTLRYSYEFYLAVYRNEAYFVHFEIMPSTLVIKSTRAAVIKQPQFETDPLFMFLRISTIMFLVTTELSA